MSGEERHYQIILASAWVQMQNIGLDLHIIIVSQ